MVETVLTGLSNIQYVMGFPLRFAVRDAIVRRSTRCGQWLIVRSEGGRVRLPPRGGLLNAGGEVRFFYPAGRVRDPGGPQATAQVGGLFGSSWGPPSRLAG